MKRDSILRTGFSPSPAAKERIWHQLQTQVQAARPSYATRWITGVACALALFIAIGIYTRPAVSPTQLAKLNTQLPLENKTTPRGLELLDNYVPYQ